MWKELKEFQGRTKITESEQSQIQDVIKKHSDRTVPYLFYESLLDYLIYNESDQPDVHFLSIESIDRGVPSHDLGSEFPDLLQSIYPNLKGLSWHQNYSYGAETAQSGINKFFEHPWVAKLSYVILQDSQSDFEFSPEWIQSVTPPSTPETTPETTPFRMIIYNNFYKDEHDPDQFPCSQFIMSEGDPVSESLSPFSES